jgi:ADP-ribose pyrophosphatase
MGTGAYPPAPQAAVGAVVFNQGRVLLICRAKQPGAGTWALPGGRIRLGETLQQAAEREIREETGVVIKAGAPLLTFDLIERDADGRVRFHYVIVDVAADYVSGSLQAGDDALEAGWFAPDQLNGMALNPATQKLLHSIQVLW